MARLAGGWVTAVGHIEVDIFLGTRLGVDKPGPHLPLSQLDWAVNINESFRLLSLSL